MKIQTGFATFESSFLAWFIAFSKSFTIRKLGVFMNCQESLKIYNIK